MRKTDPVPQEIMTGIEFRKWAEFGTETYGKTPWFFLRELAQNSRDAGADEIWVSVQRDSSDREILVFADNGSGMGFAHARKYLFRLYSSSKEKDAHAAGMYGIGFWTILHFDPAEIRIESRTRREKWGVTISRDLQVTPCPCLLEEPGTRVTLIRRAFYNDQETFGNHVRRELQHHCRFLRRRTRRLLPLAVVLENEKVNQPLELSCPLTISFRRGMIEGAVGIGDQPKVLLYAKGLSIWEGSYLEELASRLAGRPEIQELEGVYPIFLLNSNDLKVNLFRREAIADRALGRLVAVSRFYLRRLIVRYSRCAFPRHGWAGLRDSISAFCRRCISYLASPRRLIFAVILVLACIAVFRLSLSLGSRFSEPSILQPRQGLNLGLVSSGEKNLPMPILTYTPADDHLFRVHRVDHFDATKGFSGSWESITGGNALDSSCRHEGYRIRLETKGNQMIVLPCPTGFRIERPSVVLYSEEKRLPGPSWKNSDVISLPGNHPITVTYHCCPDTGVLLSDDEWKQLTRIPQPTQDGLDRLLTASNARDARLDEKLEIAASLTRRLLAYDNSREIMDRYQAQDPSRDWLSRVLAVGKGDCDVINGLMVLLLRRMGVPSRLAVGLLGSGGKMSGPLHAWTEYFSAGWHGYDITDSIRTASPQVYSSLPGYTGPSAGAAGYKKPRPAGEAILFGTALALLLGTGIVLRSSRGMAKISSQTPAEIRSGLGQIALQMIQKPRVWGWDRQLWNQRFLPLRDGGLLSMREALRYARNGRLYVARSHNTLASRLPRRGGRILDGSDSAFGRLYRVFPRIIDLDWLEGLDIRFPEEICESPLASLLADLNRLLPRVSSQLPTFLWAPGLKDRDWHHVRLHAKTRRGKSELPISFVAVNPASASLKPLTQLYAKNRRLAIFQVFRMIMTDVENECGGNGHWAALSRLLLEDLP